MREGYIKVAYFLDGLSVVHDDLEIHPDAIDSYPDCVPCPEWVKRGDTYNAGSFAQGYDNAFNIADKVVRAKLDEAAEAMGYDDIGSVMARVSYPGPFQAECASLAAWGDSCWETAIALCQQVKEGTKAFVTEEDVAAALPVRG